MKFIDTIWGYVFDISQLFYRAYAEVNSWIWPFNYLANPLYFIYMKLWDLLTPIAHFYDWAADIQSKIGAVFSWDTVKSLIKSWLPEIEQMAIWFYQWWTNIRGVIAEWWLGTQVTVKGWINESKQYAAALVAGLMGTVTNLQAAWDSFKGRIPGIDAVVSWWSNWTGQVLSTVNTWWSGKVLEVQGLINSAFTAREQLWAGWQDFRGKVVEFFTDPWGWLYDRLDDFIERYW